MLYDISFTFLSRSDIRFSSSAVNCLSWNETLLACTAFLLEMIIFIFLQACCMLSAPDIITRAAASLFAQPRRNDSVANCCIDAESNLSSPSVAIESILCIKTSKVSSSVCLAEYNLWRAVTGSSLKSNLSFNSSFNSV